MPLIHCIDASLATCAFEEHQIPALLTQVRDANSKRDISGMLLFIEGCCFQILEGAATEVDAVFERILCDRRHVQATQIIREPIFGRSFSGWTMGFATVDRIEAGGLVGENAFFNSASCVSRLDSGRAKKLLSAFASGRWRLERTDVHRAFGRSA